METKKILLVLRNREADSCYLSSNVYSLPELQAALVNLDQLGVDLVDLISFEVDLSVYSGSLK